MVISARSALALCTAFCGIWIGTAQLNALQLLPAPGLDQTVKYILDVVNADSGATRSLPSEATTWTYTMAFAAPCTLVLREERLTIQPAAAAAEGSGPTAPVREITHYIIPAADVEFGKFATHNTLQRDGTMSVTIFTVRANIRQWSGTSPAMPPEALAVFDTSINFGKPNVDNLDIPLRFQNALYHLATLCQTAAKPENDPFGPPPSGGGHCDLIYKDVSGCR